MAAPPCAEQAAGGQGERMKDLYDIARHLVWITQFGLSIAVPPLVCIFLAVFLQRSFSLGGWIVGAGIALGALGAAGGLRSSLKMIERQGRGENEKKPQPVSFDRH